MLDHHVWISVQSEYGISLGEIGKLPSDTDPKLVGNILVSLKDVISTEAINASSDFMKTEIESGASGVKSIKITDDFNVIMTYFVSRDSLGPVDNSVVNVVESLSLNLGKQLPQMLNLKSLADTGAQIPYREMTKAFLNTCSIVRMSHDIPHQKRPLLKLFEEKFQDLFKDKKSLFELIDELFGTKGWKIATYNWNSGFLVRERREEVLESLTIYLIGKIVKENPQIVLQVEQKQNLVREFNKFLSNLIRQKVKNPSKFVVDALPKIMTDKTIQEARSKIHLRSLHNSRDILFAQFVRKSILAAMKEHPEIIFVEIPRGPIQNKFDQLLPDLEVQNAGYYYSLVLEKYTSKQTHKYIRAFYDGFFRKMAGITLSKSGWEILTTFALGFVDGDTLLKEFNKIDDKSQGSRRRKELTKWTQNKKVTQLKVETIQEVIVLANASSLAITQSIYEMLIDQFLYSEGGKLGQRLETYIQTVNELGPSVKAASIMIELMNELKTNKYGIDLISPSSLDFIEKGIETEILSLEIDDIEVPYNKKQGFIHESNVYTFRKLVAHFPKFKVKYGNSSYPLVGNNLDPRLFVKLAAIDDFIFSSLLLAAQTKLKRLKDQLSARIDEMQKSLTEYSVLLSKSGTGDMKQIKSNALSKYRDEFIAQRDYPSELRELITQGQGLVLTYGDQVANFWKNIVSKFTSVASISTKDRKPLEKELKVLSKKLGKAYKEIDTLILGMQKSVEKELRQYRKKIRNVVENAGKHVLKLDLRGPTLLAPYDTVRDDIQGRIESSSVLNQDQVDQLQVGIALEIFETPSDVILEPAYNEIIQKSLSKFVKTILNEAKDRDHFEKLLVDRSYEIVDKMYDALQKLISGVESFYLNRSTPITVSEGKIFLLLGTLPVSYFRNPELIKSSFGFPGINVERSGSHWEISYEFPIKSTSEDDITVVTLRDGLRYLTMHDMKDQIEKFTESVATISELLEPNAGDRLIVLIERLYDTIYDEGI